MLQPQLDAFDVSESDGVIAGPVRRPTNVSKAAAGSIHDDETAAKLGFKGGTVAGNIHHEQFTPMMVHLFGPTWLRTGNISLFFVNPTTDGEPVQVFARRPVERPEGGLRAEVWMEDQQGRRICEGTAAIGPPDLDSELRRRLKTVRPATDLRLLAGSRVGDECHDISAHLGRESTDWRLEVITEPMPEYEDASVWGEVVAAPAVAIDAMRVVEGPLFRPKSHFVGMFGAIEVQYLAGPVFIEHDYKADGKLLALSESPKTEVAWFESTLKDASGGEPVARMILMTRLLKASSPLWA